MKIRTDFVTNSSSVSYIVTMDLEFLEFVQAKPKNNHFEREPNKKTVYTKLRDELLSGNKAVIEDRELYTKRFSFFKLNCLYDSTFDKPIEEVDLSSLDDEDLMNYIYGEYFVNARLTSEIKGLGLTQVTRDGFQAPPEVAEFVKALTSNEDKSCSACKSCDGKTS